MRVTFSSKTNGHSVMKVNGIFKWYGWKPMSKSEFERFLRIEKRLREALKSYDLPKEKYPIVEN